MIHWDHPIFALSKAVVRSVPLVHEFGIECIEWYRHSILQYITIFLNWMLYHTCFFSICALVLGYKQSLPYTNLPSDHPTCCPASSAAVRAEPAARHRPRSAGGWLEFTDAHRSWKPSAGSAVLFPHDMPHAATEVNVGTKYASWILVLTELLSAACGSMLMLPSTDCTTSH